MIRAVIFDLDGTVANTISALQEGINLTMEEFGFPLHTYDEILSYVNRGARELVRSSVPEAYRQDEVFLDKVLAAYDQNYAKVYHHTDKAYDGIPEVVATLHENYKIGVLSNKQDLFVKRLCEQVLMPGSYDVAQGVPPGFPTKPSPILSARVANLLGVDLSECVMIGDSDVDIATAKNAGMKHIGVSWGFREESLLRAKGATLIAHTPGEIPNILKTIQE